MIDFSCPHCGHSIAIDDRFAGKTGKCARCGNKATVPERAAPSPPVATAVATAVVPSKYTQLNLQQCEDCDGMVSLRAIACPHCGAIQRKELPPPPAPKFSSLRALSSVYFAAGIICIIVAVAVVIASSMDKAENLPSAAVAFFGALIVSGCCFVVSEGIDLFLRIEENTRRK